MSEKTRLALIQAAGVRAPHRGGRGPTAGGSLQRARWVVGEPVDGRTRRSHRLPAPTEGRAVSKKIETIMAAAAEFRGECETYLQEERYDLAVRRAYHSAATYLRAALLRWDKGATAEDLPQVVVESVATGHVPPAVCEEIAWLEGVRASLFDDPPAVVSQSDAQRAARLAAVVAELVGRA